MKYRESILTVLWLLFIVTGLQAQMKKPLDHDAYKEWRRTSLQRISNDGNWISYTLKSNAEANDILELSTFDGNQILSYERATDGKFSNDSKYFFYTIKPDLDEVKTMRRNKVKKDDLPMDTLVIHNLAENTTRKIARLKSYKIPLKWDGWFAYLAKEEPDSVKGKDDLHLNIEHFNGGKNYTFPAVSDYLLSEKGGKIAFVSDGNDSTFLPGVYVFDYQTEETKPIFRSKGKYQSLTWSEQGNRLAFVSDLDTTKVLIRPNNLHLWKSGTDSAMTIANANSEELIGEWLISEHYRNSFSKDESKLFFGIKPYPVLQDTALLEEEIVKVEVWSYEDTRLHPQQKVNKSNDLKQAYTSIYHIGDQKIVKLASKTIPDLGVGNEGNSKFHLGMSNLPYLTTISWEGFPVNHDVYLMNDETGSSELVAKKINATPRISPGARYFYWYDQKDSAWFTFNIATKKTTQITDNKIVPYYYELHDTPSNPSPYGIASWTEDDEKILIYDRYDIWETDPDGLQKPKRITPVGRNNKTTYRYRRLDKEERYITAGQKLLLTSFNEVDKSAAIHRFIYNKKAKKVSQLFSGNYRYDLLVKSQKSDKVIFTKESFREFPDILSTDMTFKNTTRISNANPQQDDYRWGDIELYKWTAFDGTELEGLLVKPDDFDPNKKYPLLVNFYERSSDRLYSHLDPYPHRSTINYSFYTSRGYVIFNPDVVYKTGYPGESAFNCVMSGVEALLKEGFIDKDRIGAQGHSWGGYQVAYLATKTDKFRCIESGAPVPNMTSAYGGIRWGSGLSRMFQYEHTQSRIGGTLWEYRDRYIENSPIFFLDKITTPILIMHNDEDGAVPWYQGIEFFVGLRRLGKPSWMLNYQGEPHWPLKLQNRIDFNIRMQQFFDHYLMDAKKPRWMKEGVPATKMGIDQALDLEK
ncbi:MAG: prolyl oligopeptidase family serine peptidase [Bacteroidota bacterium]